MKCTIEHRPICSDTQSAIDNPQSMDAAVQAAESAMLKLPQAHCPVTNRFAPGIYWREIEIPAGAIALGHKHKTEHLNVLLSGRVRVLCDGQVKELVAPQVFSSPPGTRKIVFALEPTRWANIHANPTDEHDMEKLELIFIEKSAAFLAHHQAACAAAYSPAPAPSPSVAQKLWQGRRSGLCSDGDTLKGGHQTPLNKERNE